MPLPNWARAYGGPLFTALIRSRPEDFDVTEELGFEFSDDGEHDYLFVEKTNANTDWVSRQLANHASVPPRDIGYAGLKDRYAVTRQWFSVPRWNAPDWQQLQVEGVQLLEQRRHSRKLRRGAHRANRFRLVLRGELASASQLRDRMALLAAKGVPNYFGEQRFGRGGANIALADQWADGKRLPRHKRSFAISAARSYLFNEQLDGRVRDGSWNRLVAGDFANLDGSGSVFPVQEPDAELDHRCVELDIHPAGTLPGEGSPASGAAAHHQRWLTALGDARVKPASRSFRLRVAGLDWSVSGESLSLAFALPRGAFATSVLRELADVRDAPR